MPLLGNLYLFLVPLAFHVKEWKLVCTDPSFFGGPQRSKSLRGGCHVDGVRFLVFSGNSPRLSRRVLLRFVPHLATLFSFLARFCQLPLHFRRSFDDGKV